MSPAVVLEVVRLALALLETRKPEDVIAHLRKLADEGVRPIEAGDLDAIEREVRDG